MPTLDWIGKTAVVTHHRDVPYHLLHCDKALSAGDTDARNLLVQGDNLLALKALLPYYAGKVKCIYIDPPYNTGNENWVYNDNVNSPEIRRWLEKTVGKEGEDLSRHDKWLCMMYPRLALLKEFLSEDGAIFISIDDNEVQNLRMMMDEVFGGQYFVAQCSWQKAYSPRMDAKSVSWDHDYVVVFARSPETQLRRLSFVQDAGQFGWVDETSGHHYRRRQWRKEGSGARRADRPNLFYSIIAPDGSEVLPIRPDGSEGRWRGNKIYFDSLAAANEIDWVRQPNSWQIYVKQFATAESTKPPSTWWPSDEFGHNHEAAEEIRNILGAQRFPTPKPTRLIRRILEIATDKDSLILDSFAGSGTTGHAVLALNKADGGNRRFILVEMDEKICRDVTAQRLTRVIDGYGDVPGLGGGFRFCTLGQPLFDEHGQIRDGVAFADLAAHIFFTETGSPIPNRASGKSPLLGVHDGKAVYLLFNGVLGDKRVNGGNVLTAEVLRKLPAHDGPRIIYGEGCRQCEARIRRTKS